ncbi:hypothetical protein GCM10029978_031100 [Actinoallomurus acanthiterrae]
MLLWLRVLVMPALGLTGLVLWKQAQLRRVVAFARRRLGTVAHR